MRKITLITLMLFTALSYAQVGINTNTPDASSALEIESTTGGILIPRMTETQRDAIVSPASGLMIYQTDEISGFYFYDGTAWAKIDGVAGPAGPQGETGVQGPVGPTGSSGPVGPVGPVGPSGTNGSSAYEIWTTAGNTGTTSDFLASLVGAQGIPGPQGETGPQGIQGGTGLSGSAAPAGSIIRLMIQNGSTIFINSDLYSADLSGFDLSGIDFSGAIFTGVSSGNVSGNPTLPSGYSIVNGYIVGPRVNLSNADLINQDLSGVDLSGADLSGADLSGADMTNAILPNKFANIKKIEIKKSIGGHQTIRAMHFIVNSDSGEFDAARPAYATASTTNVNHQSPNFGGTRDIIHMIGDNKTNTNNYTYNGGDTGTILFNTPYNISEFKEMTIYGWAQFSGGYYNRIADTQYILYTENNVKIYDFTTPSEHSNGDQKAIYRIAGPAGISDGSIWTADANGHFANVNYSGGHYTLDVTVSPLVTIEN